MSNLSVKFQPTYEEYLRVKTITTYNKPTIVLLILIGILTIATLLGFIFGWLEAEMPLLIWYLLPPGMFIFYLIHTPLDLRGQAQSMAAKKSTIEWRISEAQISVHTDGSVNEHTWEMLGTAQETDDLFILYLKSNRSEYIFIPKRAFRNPTQQAEFREAVSAHLGEFKSSL